MVRLKGVRNSDFTPSIDQQSKQCGEIVARRAILTLSRCFVSYTAQKGPFHRRGNKNKEERIANVADS